MAITLVDLQVGPFSDREAIEAEIDRIRRLEQDDGTVAAIEQLETWLNAL